MNKLVRVVAHFVTPKSEQDYECEIDTLRLERDMAVAIAALNKEGYEVISVTPVTSGAYNFVSTGGFKPSWGYSYTDAVMIIGRRAPIATVAGRNA
jgi:hypothetical protein